MKTGYAASKNKQARKTQHTIKPIYIQLIYNITPFTVFVKRE